MVRVSSGLRRVRGGCTSTNCPSTGIWDSLRIAVAHDAFGRYPPSQDGCKLGRIKFVDLNGDNKITADDRTVIGTPHPDFTGSLDLGYRYGNFDLSGTVFGSFGNEIFDAQKEFYVFRQFSTNVRADLLENSWTPTNTNAKYPIIDIDDSYSKALSNYYVEDGSYVRLRNVQLGLQRPAALRALAQRDARLCAGGEPLHDHGLRGSRSVAARGRHQRRGWRHPRSVPWHRSRHLPVEQDVQHRHHHLVLIDETLQGEGRNEEGYETADAPRNGAVSGGGIALRLQGELPDRCRHSAGRSGCRSTGQRGGRGGQPHRRLPPGGLQQRRRRLTGLRRQQLDLGKRVERRRLQGLGADRLHRDQRSPRTTSGRGRCRDADPERQVACDLRGREPHQRDAQAAQAGRGRTQPTALSAADQAGIEGEAKFLRAHYMFEAYRMWGNVPYHREDDEDLRKAAIAKAPSRPRSWRTSTRRSPSSPPRRARVNVGRATQWTAKAYKGTLQMYTGSYAAGAHDVA